MLRTSALKLRRYLSPGQSRSLMVPFVAVMIMMSGICLLAGIAESTAARILLLSIIPVLAGSTLYAFMHGYNTHQLCISDDTADRTHSLPKATHEDFLKHVQFADLFNAAPAGDVLLDKDYNILHFNTSFAEKFLQGDQVAIHTPFAHLINPEDWPHVLKKITPSMQMQAVPFEFQLRTGLDVAAYANVFPYVCFTTGETVQGIFLQLFDNSDQKIKQQRLAQSQKNQAIGQLAGGIAHDFNNLLTAMIGFCDLMLMRHTEGDQCFNDVLQVKQNANRAANLVKQLLAFSRQQALQPRVLNISEILGNLSILLQRLTGPAIYLDIAQEGELGLVKVDASQFEQVIMNLVVNARDAMEEGGKIRIRTFNKQVSLPLYVGAEVVKPGTYVVIEVADNGSGIEAEHLSRIFDPFFSTKEVGSGTGLGLATAHGIIKQTGGYIAVESVKGQGTKFQIYLPHYQGKAPTNNNDINASSLANQCALNGKETILLVEDEDAVRHFSARALRNKGYHVIEAAHGEEAYHYLKSLYEHHEKPVDLVITDVVMPLMDGPTLARRALELYPHLKIVFMSGYAEDSFRKKLGEGEVQFLPKPFNLTELAEKVRQVLGMEMKEVGQRARYNAIH